MFDLMAASWWNGVSGMASVVAIITAVVAVRQWVRDKRRIMDAYLDVSNLGGWGMRNAVTGERIESGQWFRVQNIGGTGMCLHRYWVKGMKITAEPYDDAPAPTPVLMPGECLSIYTKGNPEKGAEIVFQYVTHNDADLIHFDRFLIDDLVSEGFMIATSVHPGWRARRRLRYRGKDLFSPFGLSRIRRVLRLNATSRHQAALIREATDWLSREGYEAYSIGAYANDEG